MIYSSMLTMCVLMNPLSKKDLTLIFWVGQPWDLLLLIWNQKAPAPSPQRVISILWILIISLNLLMYIRLKCKRFYSTMISSKVRIPNGFKKLTADFGLSNAQEVFSIPYLVAKGKQLVNLSKCELCLLAPSLRQQLVIVLCFYRVLVEIY